MISTVRLSAIMCFICISILPGPVCSKRRGKFLIYPLTMPTRAQLIYGIGIPVVPLKVESMTSGWVLKAEYFLPEIGKPIRITKIEPVPISALIRSLDSDAPIINSTVLPGQDYDDKETLRYIREKSDEPNGSRKRGQYRWALYRLLETLGTRVGVDGRACVLRTLCEVAASPFDYTSGLMGELLHIVLTPSSSVDPLSRHSDYEYFRAENLGKSGAPCHIIFKECENSPLSLISILYDPLNKVVRR